MGKKRQVRNFRANGVRFRIQTSSRKLLEKGEEVWGVIDYNKNVVIVCPEAAEETLLDTRVHEFTHGFFDAGNQRLLHEETVDRFATELSIFLWRLGYRCPQDEDFGKE